MYIYNGKLNWYDYAVDENVTFVFSGGFTPDERVLECWQWTVDAKGVKNANNILHGTIVNGSLPAKFAITGGYYSFDCTISDDLSTLEVNMRNPNGDRNPSGPSTLKKVFAAPTIRSSVVYTGKIDWFSYCKDEMVIVVLPDGVAAGSPVGMYYQWTVTASGEKKQNFAMTTSFKTTGFDSDGQVTGEYGSQYYTFDITVTKTQETVYLAMTNPSGGRDPKAPYALTLVPSPVAEKSG